MARPKTNPEEKLSQVILLRVTLGQMAQLSQLCLNTHQPIGQLIRNKLFKGRFPKAVLARTDQQTVIELNRIGVNLNQLTRKVNAGLLPSGLQPLLYELLQHQQLLLNQLLHHDSKSEDH